MDFVCRTCLACENDLEPLFSKRLVDSDYMDLTTMILLCTGLEIEDDKLCNAICTQCIESIIAAFKYRSKVWKSHAVLLEATKVLEDVYVEDKDTNISNDEPTLEQQDNESVPCQGIDEFYHTENHDSYDGELVSSFKYRKKNCADVHGNGTDCIDVKFIEPEVLSQIADEPNTSGDDTSISSRSESDIKYRDIDRYIHFSYKSPTERTFVCTFCGQTYELVGTVRNHLIHDHDMPLLQTYKCKTCSKMFVNKKYYRRHVQEAHQSIEVTNKNFICDLCGEKFRFSSQLAKHVDRHNGVKPYKCKICDFCAVSSTELKLHNRKHTGEKPYVCFVCGVGFISSSHRSAHVSDVHTDGRPYECEICGKTYKSRRVYKSHMQIHDPSHNIKCEICNKEFNYRKTLVVHMRKHHEKFT